jgi:hypothetical protein
MELVRCPIDGSRRGGCFRIFDFQPRLDGPDLYGALSFFETTPSRPSLQTASNSLSPMPLGVLHILDSATGDAVVHPTMRASSLAGSHFLTLGVDHFFRLVFIRCPLVFDFSLFRFSLFRHLVTPLGAYFGRNDYLSVCGLGFRRVRASLL